MGIEIRTRAVADFEARWPDWQAFQERRRPWACSTSVAMLRVLEAGLGHRPSVVEACDGERVVGLLPLAEVASVLFGRFLVSLPYVNYGGAQADDEDVARRLVDRAIDLAEERRVRHLELRHEQPIAHPALTLREGAKDQLRLALPPTSEALWKQLSPKVRNQIRKAEKQRLTVDWGGLELLDPFYDVFAWNMRDLGTPVYGRALFHQMLVHLHGRAELIVVRFQQQPVAVGLTLHGGGVTEAPSASSLRNFRQTNANMLMYWQMLRRAIERGQETFDFGRSTPASSTWKFKAQWGARPFAANWQYYLRRGQLGDMRPDNPRFRRLVEAWKWMPVWLSRWVGPWIVRGIP
jgi:FemAB-related protein (PEP-CTERM system-associated)